MRNVLLAIVMMAPLAACSQREPAAEPATDTKETPASPAGADAAAPAPAAPSSVAGAGAPAVGDLSPQDAEALGLLSAINQHEIKAAQQAKQHDLPADVATFADMMVRDHTDNDAKLHALGQPADTPAVQSQKAKGEAELRALGDHRKDYAKAYVDAMVKGHTEALATLDDKLIPEASAQPVRTHLSATREAVAAHLERAKALQGQ